MTSPAPAPAPRLAVVTWLVLVASAADVRPAHGDEVDDLLELVSTGAGGERSRALARLGFLGSDRAVAVLARGLRDADADVRVAACRDLADLGALAAAPHLTAALADPETSVRREAALGLGAVRDRRAVEPLSRRLRDESSLVRAAAAVALGRIGGPAAERAVASRAGAEAEPEVQAALAEALGAIGGEVALRALRTLARASDPRIADAAAAALAPHGDPAAMQALFARISSDDPAARARAALALAHPAFRHASGRLAEILLADPDDGVRAASATALSAQGDPRGLRFLIAGAAAGPEGMRIACTQALDRMHVPEERRAELARRILDYPPVDLRSP
jgi:HEAT repeat protein